MLAMQDSIYIYGKHAVIEALKKRGQDITAMWLRDDVDQTSLRKYLSPTVTVQSLNEKRLPGELSPAVVHQGYVAALNESALLTPFKDFVASLDIAPSTALVVLGEVQDPHNVGAIIRSAAAFGVAGVLVPKHRQSPITGTVIKVSTGTAFSVPLVSVGNVNSALRSLKEKGFWVYGLDMNGDTNLHSEKFPRPTVLVVGNEGQGIRAKTHELCDSILEIPMHERVESLNASVSSAIAMYAWSQAHPEAL